MDQISCFNRGKLVWARKIFPHKWWPGLVLGIDSLGVLVSFFDYAEPHYFLESEVCSFEENFPILIKNVKYCSTSEALLDRALKLLGHRAAMALNCPCVNLRLREHFGHCRRQQEPNQPALNSFMADVVLGFVLDTALLPWVDEDALTDAVIWRAQITTFRMYSSIQQKRVYEKAGSIQTNTLVFAGSCSEMQPFLSVNRNMQPFVQQSDALRPIDGCQMFSKQVENELRDSSVLISNESFESFHEDQPVIRTENESSKRQEEQALYGALTKLHSFALVPFHLVGECLNTVKRKFRAFRILSHPNVSDPYLNICAPSKRTEAPIYNLCHKQSHISIMANGSNCGKPMFDAMVPHMHSPVGRLWLKRKPDQSEPSGPHLKLLKTMHLSIIGADACLQRANTVCEAGLSDIFLLRFALSDLAYKLCKAAIPCIPSGIADSYLQKHRTGFEAKLSDSFFCNSQVHLESQNTFSKGTQSLTFVCNRCLLDLFQRMFNLPFPFPTSGSHHTDIVEIGMDQEHSKNVDTLSNYLTYISHFNMQRPEKGLGILREDGTNSCSDNDIAQKMIHKAPAEEMKVDYSVRFQQSSETNHVIRRNINDEDTRHTSGVSTKCVMPCHLAATQTQKQDSNSDYLTYVKSNSSASMNVDCEDTLEKKGNLHQPSATDLSFKSAVTKRSGALGSSATCKTLHMKFPKDYKAPSKEELVKKFSSFGRVDHLRTKVYSLTGSAQVVFLQSLDAVAAYQYAMRKKVVFGHANILFWLDPYESNRRGSKFSATYPSSSTQQLAVKSCLKRSDSRQKEAKGGPRKVRFLMET